MQSTYNSDVSKAVAGQLVERGEVTGRYQCSEDIPPGRFVELHSDGKLRLPQGTGADIAKLVGVAMYRGALEPGAYKAGDYVPVIRKGKVWCEYVSGATVADLTTAKVYHSSTVDTNRGKVGSAAESGIAGSEIDDVGRAAQFDGNSDATALIALVSVNLP